MKNNWLDKYIPQAQNGIEGTMGGLTDKGFNYNGAWGGPSMQIGGSIPGSPGFTYARTQDAAPSNGKYAKKTLASAQNGQEMKFWQEGLDWKPKNISEDGTVIDPDGYWNSENWGKEVVIPSSQITMKGVDVPLLGISDTGDIQMMQPGQDYTYEGEYVTEIPMMQDGDKVTKSPVKNFFSNYMNSDLYKNKLKYWAQPIISPQEILNSKILLTDEGSKARATFRYPGLNESEILLDANQAKKYNLNLDDVYAHELSHIQRPLGYGEQLYIASLNNNKDNQKRLKNYKKENPVNKYTNKSIDYSSYLSGDHDNQPDELKADLDALRYMMYKNNIYDASKRNMTIKDYNKAIQNPKIKSNLSFKRLSERFKVDNILDLDKYIGAEDSNIKERMQEGGDLAINKVVISPKDWREALSQVEKKDGSIGMWGNPVDSLKNKQPIKSINPIGNTDHRGVRSGHRYQGSPQTSKLIELKEQQLKAQSSRTSYQDGGWLNKYN